MANVVIINTINRSLKNMYKVSGTFSEIRKYVIPNAVKLVVLINGEINELSKENNEEIEHQIRVLIKLKTAVAHFVDMYQQADDEKSFQKGLDELAIAVKSYTEFLDQVHMRDYDIMNAVRKLKVA